MQVSGYGQTHFAQIKYMKKLDVFPGDRNNVKLNTVMSYQFN